MEGAQRAGKKGQSSVETLILFGFVAAFSIPIILLLYGTTNYSTDDLSLTQASISTQAIADAASEVYAQGVPANRVILVNYPNGLRNISIRSGGTGVGEIVFILDGAKGRTNEVVATTFFPDVNDAAANRLNDEQRYGKIYLGAGLHAVNVTAVNLSNNRIGVEISYAR